MTNDGGLQDRLSGEGFLAETMQQNHGGLTAKHYEIRQYYQSTSKAYVGVTTDSHSAESARTT